jgi:hypothetical protein
MLIEWAISAALLGLLFTVFFDDASTSSIVIGLLISGPIYLIFGAAMAKLGYQRASLRQARAQRAAASTASTAAPAPRPKPAPTKRTGGGTPQRRR